MLVLRFGEIWGPRHGGDGGTESVMKLDPDDHIIAVQGKCGKNVDRIEFLTYKGEFYGPWGGNGGSVFHATRPQCKLAYMSGNAGKWVDSITLHWEC